VITDSLVSSLRQIVSADYVLDDEQALALYGADCSGGYGMPGLVVLPGTEREVAGVLRLLSVAELPVTIRGAGDGIVGGAVPAHGGVVLATARLNGPIRFVPEDGVAVAAAGTRLNDLRRHAARVGLSFGSPLPVYRYETVGGAVARDGDGLGGPTGGMHGIVRGLRAVLCDGAVLAADGTGAGRQNLHASGLLIGSEGGLGVITEATLALRRRMPADRAILATFEDPIVAAHAGAGLISAGACPLVADVVDAATWRRVADWPGSEASDGALLVWLSGLEGDVDDEVAWVLSICRDYMAQRAAVLDADQTARIVPAWSRLVRESRPVQRDVPLDLAVPVARLPELLESAYENARDRGVSIVGLARIVDGTLAMHVPVPLEGSEAAEKALQLVETLADHAGELQGTSLALHGVGTRRTEHLRTIYQQSNQEALRLIKQAFDVEAIFSVPVAPPATKERRNLRQRHALEGQLAHLRDVLAARVESVIAVGEPVEIEALSAQMLAHVLRTAARFKVPVAIHDQPEDRLLDVWLTGMSQIAMLDADSRVMALEAGATLAELQEAALAAGLWWPTSPLVAPEMRLSDFLAWHRSDSRGLGWGQPTERVIGIDAVDGRGDMLSWGGLAQVQHAGVRLAELCLGARNRYAVITAAALQLAPAPSMRAAVAAEFAELAGAYTAALAWLGYTPTGEALHCRPSAVWVLSSVKEDGQGALQAGPTRAFAEFAGLPSSVERQVRWAKHIAEQSGAVDIREAFDDEADALWVPAAEVHRQRPAGSRTDDALHLVIWTAWAAWPELTRKILNVVRVHGYPCRMLMDMGAGRMDVRVERGAVEPAPLLRLLSEAVLPAKATMEIWSPPAASGWIAPAAPEVDALRARLKAQFDPAGILPAGWGPRIKTIGAQKEGAISPATKA